MDTLSRSASPPACCRVISPQSARRTSLAELYHRPGTPASKPPSAKACSLARSLEIVGERWTLLIIRHAFWGVRRFGDFLDHLGMPRAVLASRLKALTAAGVMTKVAGQRHLEYELTDKGTALWPAVLSLMSWGDDFCAPGGPRRLFRHAADGGQVDRCGGCDACGRAVPAADTIIAPGPGLEPSADDDSWVTAALTTPHRLLEPLRAAEASAVP